MDCVGLRTMPVLWLWDTELLLRVASAMRILHIGT